MKNKNKRIRVRYEINGKAYRRVYVLQACMRSLGLEYRNTKEELAEAIKAACPGVTGSVNDLIIHYASKLDGEGIDIGRSVRSTKCQIYRKTKWPGNNTKKKDFGSDFYSSREWRELRYLALRNTDGRCQCCGATSKDGVRIHVDHIKPRSMFPELSLCLNNLQVLCEDCNVGKGCWDTTDWRQHA